MKTKIVLIIAFCFGLNAIAQENLMLEYNQLKTVKFTTYEIPLKINQVAAQAAIDYTTPKGVVQSFYSANSLDWALSDYLKTPENIVRDQAHFEAVKKRNIATDYAQLESLYEFEFNGRQFCYVKYSAIMKDVPFPLMMFLSLEKSGNRWYISQLLNQNQVSKVFLNLDQAILKMLFSGKNINEVGLTALISPYIGNKFSFTKMDKILSESILENKKDIINSIQDKRIIGDGNLGSKAVENSKSTIATYQIEHPFILDSAQYFVYEKNTVITNKDTSWKNQPEYLLVKNNPIKLESNFSFFENGAKYNIITYNDDVKKTAIIAQDMNGSHIEVEKFKGLSVFFNRIDIEKFYQILEEEPKNKNLKRIKSECSSFDGVLNLSLLLNYLELNPGEKNNIFENRK